MAVPSPSPPPATGRRAYERSPPRRERVRVRASDVGNRLDPPSPPAPLPLSSEGRILNPAAAIPPPRRHVHPLAGPRVVFLPLLFAAGDRFDAAVGPRGPDTRANRRIPGSSYYQIGVTLPPSRCRSTDVPCPKPKIQRSLRNGRRFLVLAGVAVVLRLDSYRLINHWKTSLARDK